jgi:Ca2+/Na+ antiporter
VYIVYIILLYMGKSIWDDEEELSEDDERSLVSQFTEEERHMILSGELEVKDILHSRVGGRRGSQVGGGGGRRTSISGRRRSQQFNRRHSQSIRRLSTVVPPGLDSESNAPVGDVEGLKKAEPPADSTEPTTVMGAGALQPGGEPMGEAASEQEGAEAGPFDDLDVDAHQGFSEGPGTTTAADQGSGSGTGMATEDSPLLNKDLEAEFDEDANDEEERAGCCATLVEYASCPFYIILEYTVPDLQVAEDERNAIEEERMVIEGTCLLAKQNRSSALLESLFSDHSPEAPAVTTCLRRFKLNMLWLLREEPRKGCCDCSVEEVVEGAGKRKNPLGTMQERAHHAAVLSNMIFNWRDATWKSAAMRKTETVEDLRASLALCVRELEAANAELEPREAQVSRWELNQAILTFILALGYTAVLSMATLAVVKGLSNTMGMPKSLAGVTLVAIGAEVPDTFASLAMAKLGEGPSAVSNCLNSQIINILIGLGLPYFIKSAITGLPMDMPKTGSTQVFIGVCLGTIVAMWMLVTVGVQACKRAKQPSLTPVSGYILISVYIIAVIAITLKTVL